MQNTTKYRRLTNHNPLYHPCASREEKRRGVGEKSIRSGIPCLPTELKKTLTYDQDKEMLGHKRFTIDTGIQAYFANSGSPWERGTKENTNGLIRQYFPKGTDFSKVSRYQIKRAERRLNGRPRAVLDYEKPIEVINRLVALKV